MPEKKSETAFCELCDKEHPVSDMEDFFGKLLCSNCLQAETFVCSCCHALMPRSEIATYDDDVVEICQTCYDEHYTRCEGCGLLALSGRLLPSVLRSLLQRAQRKRISQVKN